jgi:hypothetical protein
MFGVVVWDDNMCATDDSPPGPMAGTAQCASTYPAGTTIELSAQSYNREDNPEFTVQWGADASTCGTDPRCTIVIETDLHVTTTFTPAG